MKKLIIAFLLVLSFTGTVSAEITKGFDQFSGTATISSTKTAALNDVLDVKVDIEKRFFANDSFKDIGATTITIGIIPKGPIPSPILANHFQWIADGELVGHTEKFMYSPASSSRLAQMSPSLKKAISDGKMLMFKVPLITGKDQIFKITTETINEWQSVVTHKMQPDK